MTTTSTTPHHRRINLNIGGTHFSTTTSTLNSTTTTPDSLLSTTHHHHNNNHHDPTFIDRDPSIFSALLSLLRTRRLSTTTLRHFSLHHLATESTFYGLNPSLLSSALSPPPLSPFDAAVSHFLSPPSSPLISAFSATSSALLLAHSGQISTYDPSTLLRTTTNRTHFDHISSIRHLSPDIAAVGSDSATGLHFYSTLNGKHVGGLHWWDPADLRTQKARVTAIDGGGDSDSGGGECLFASFECHHGENAVLMVDNSTLKVVSEIGRQSGIAAKSSAVRKLKWVPSIGVLVGSSVTCGAFGYSGYIRVWDLRSGGGKPVWETSEPGGECRISRVGDTMADVDVDAEGLYLAKVGSRSGDLGLADLRKLGPDPWVYLEDPNPALRGVGVGGERVVVSCYKKHVYVGKGGGLEAWSRVEGRESGVRVLEGGGEERDWGVYRRNHVDKVEDAQRGVITKIQGGGNRLFVCRENVEGIEVWETSAFSGVKKI